MSGVDYRIDGALARLTLNRPEKLNAITGAMLDEIEEALDRAAADDGVRVLIVDGRGRAFSAGFDLVPDAAQGGGDDPLRAELERDFAVLMKLHRFPKPVIAAVHGYCLGFALELAALCDLVVAAEGCRFGAPEVRFGSGVVCLILPWIIGQKNAREILLTGSDRIDAGRALQMGLVNRVVPPGSLDDVVTELATEISLNDPVAVRLTKQALNESLAAAGLHEALKKALEIDIEIESTETPESAEFNRILAADGARAALEWRASVLPKRRSVPPDDSEPAS